MGKLSYIGDNFYLDNKPFRIISGAIHYFRVVPEYWEDRLKKLKACGFNTVETYMCWNLHERVEGQFDFSGILDISKFIEIARSLDLYVIVRPGPYICAEWEFGGLPSWLLSYDKMKLRCNNDIFVDKTKNYLVKVFSELKQHLNGNILAMQIENEYGSYGNDHEYLNNLKKIYEENVADVLLFTSDGPTNTMLNGGSIDGCLSMANFGSNSIEAFKTLRAFHKNQPAMCGEFWNGWFDHWYEEHHTREASDVAKVLEDMLLDNGNVNFFMFHGGTNFGFLNGANYQEVYEPTITSYDYDALCNECGDLTPKYYAVKEVLEKHFNKKSDIEVANLPKFAYGNISLTHQLDLFENLDAVSEPIYNATPLTMEDIGQDFGFILYSTVYKGKMDSAELEIDGLHDRAIIYINGEFAGIKERTNKRNDKIVLNYVENEDIKIDILVENMGRVNYGKHLHDKKGILGSVRIGYQNIYGWTMRAISCENLNLNYAKSDNKVTRPTFLKGSFNATTLADTFVRLDGFTKGIVLINGFNLGRYWNTAGPQRTLYLPAPLLVEGENEIVVFELEQCDANVVLLTDEIDLG